MFESIKSFFQRLKRKKLDQLNSGDAAKERLHLVLMQDRANVSADYIDLMKQDIIDDIKKYVDVDEKEIDVRLTNQINNDGSNGAPSLYANIPITSIKKEKKNVDNIKNTENNTKNNRQVRNSILGTISEIDTSEEKRKNKKTKVESSEKNEVD